MVVVPCKICGRGDSGLLGPRGILCPDDGVMFYFLVVPYEWLDMEVSGLRLAAMTDGPGT
jgi:hypothetical protein